MELSLDDWAYPVSREERLGAALAVYVQHASPPLAIGSSFPRDENAGPAVDPHVAGEWVTLLSGTPDPISQSGVSGKVVTSHGGKPRRPPP